mmetsp:Transcript_20481/g.31198  ORF Transcript_20481/g.31198 Transcript_20481/m.31198 type:complete len:84 (-) Transcript_20481:102-353(-)
MNKKLKTHLQKSTDHSLVKQLTQTRKSKVFSADGNKRARPFRDHRAQKVASSLVTDKEKNSRNAIINMANSKSKDLTGEEKLA